MLTDRTWEEETLALIDDARREERRAEQKVQSAQKLLSAARHKREALEESLRYYRKAYGIPQGGDSIDPELAGEFQGKSLREMLHLWAARHEGLVVMKDISDFLTVAGLFKNKQQASGALHSTAQRTEEFKKIERGVFQLVQAENKVSSNGYRPTEPHYEVESSTFLANEELPGDLSEDNEPKAEDLEEYRRMQMIDEEQGSEPKEDLEALPF